MPGLDLSRPRAVWHLPFYVIACVSMYGILRWEHGDDLG